MPDASSLAGPLARIDRADELLGQLDAKLKAFIATRPYTAVEQPDPNPLNRKYLITHIQDVPVPLRVLVGEASHHLRASLDLLVYQLLIKEGVTNDKRLRSCSFPIIVSRDLVEAEEKRKHDDAVRNAIDGVSHESYRRIEALQPCANNREWSHLAQVQELDNTDKHRLLLAGFASTRLPNFAFHDGENVHVVKEAFVPLQVDAVFLFNGVPPGRTVTMPLATHVTFNEPGPVFGHPIVHILQNLSKMTRDTIQSFADCF